MGLVSKAVQTEFQFFERPDRQPSISTLDECLFAVNSQDFLEQHSEENKKRDAFPEQDLGYHCKLKRSSSSSFWRDIIDAELEDHPKLGHMLISFVCMSGALALALNVRRSTPKLFERMSVKQHVPEYRFDGPRDPASCRRKDNFITHGVAVGARSARALLGAGWAGIGSFYCGPPNGRDFSQQPSDVLDAACAQHDFCIERSRYLVPGGDEAAVARPLYPVGLEDPDKFRRCGIPLQSHRHPTFAARIARCDEELLASLRGGLQCAEDPELPKGPWCAAMAGRRACEEHAGSWRGPLCRSAAALVSAYHRWKLARSAASPLPPPAAS